MDIKKKFGVKIVVFFVFFMVCCSSGVALPSITIPQRTVQYINTTWTDYWDSLDTPADIGITDLTDDFGLVQSTDWTTIDDYPSACSSGYYVQGIGDTLTCVSLSTYALNSTFTQYDTWNFNQSAHSIAWVVAQGYTTTAGTVYNDTSINATIQDVSASNTTTWNMAISVNDSNIDWNSANGTFGLNTTFTQYDTWNFNQSAHSIAWVVAQGYGSGSGMNYTNLALTNESETFDLNLTIEDSLNVSNGLIVDTNLLYVNPHTNKIGIGIIPSPSSYKFSLDGGGAYIDNNFGGALLGDGENYFLSETKIGVVGQTESGGAWGGAFANELLGYSVYLAGGTYAMLIPLGDVGIGTNTPTSKLHVDGDVNATGLSATQICLTGDSCITSWGSSGSYNDTSINATIQAVSASNTTTWNMAISVNDSNIDWNSANGTFGLNTTFTQYDTWNFNQSAHSITWVEGQGYLTSAVSSPPSPFVYSGTEVFLNNTFDTLNISGNLYAGSSNVGIGTNAPLQKLHIEEGGIKINNDSVTNVPYMNVTSGQTDIFLIDEGGNIGRGVSQPLADIHVYSPDGTDGSTIYAYSVNAAAGLVAERSNGKWTRLQSGVRSDFMYENGGMFSISEADPGDVPYQKTFSPVRHITVVSGGFVGIGTDAPSAPLTVYGSGSAPDNITAWFEGNVSATGYFTRTSVFDTRKNVWDYIHDAEDYKDSSGNINHSAFYGYEVHQVKDNSRPVVIDSVTDELCKPVWSMYANLTKYQIGTNCTNITSTLDSYPYVIDEEGVDLGSEIDLLRQAVYELKQENIALEERIKALEKI